MAKSYSDSSSQTIEIDPDNYLKKYEKLKQVTNCGTHADQGLDESTEQDGFYHNENIHERLDNQSDSDSSSLDQEQELQRRLNPSTPEDFETLQSELLQWRHREERKITITARNEEHRQEMKKIVLKKEAHLLRKIEQLKSSATNKCKTEKIEQMMERMSQPKQWEVSNGSVIGVHTPETCRARELKAMYDELNMKVDKVGTRIKLLERIKAMTETIDHCGLAKDVCSLLDRELQMLYRGTDLGPEFMDGMRNRLSNQFTKLVRRLNFDSIDCTAAKFQLHRPLAINNAA
eukprot:CAMPEP_0183776886 /NCGR_PEP_ID=MMETSP0739-20130205/47813_1 /TAXON_ID=385413 /ORGANISM="Thalassiosira miniscula, Strain CCMP1093" /LENGTH=289 /DNA_ID=CAMNT_0026018859 /DNA_START=444 /DNA_END=1313 /DNA_ORIENTATION=-